MSPQTKLGKTQRAPKAVADEVTIGIGIGDRGVITAFLAMTETLWNKTVPKVEGSIEKHFKRVPHTQIAMEAGSRSIWIREQRQEYGHEVLVANVIEFPAIVGNGAADGTGVMSPLKCEADCSRLW